MSNIWAPVSIILVNAHITIHELNITVPSGNETPQFLDNGVMWGIQHRHGMPRIVNMVDVSNVDLNQTTLADGIATILAIVCGHDTYNFCNFTDFKECVVRIDNLHQGLGWGLLIARTKNDILAGILTSRDQWILGVRLCREQLSGLWVPMTSFGLREGYDTEPHHVNWMAMCLNTVLLCWSQWDALQQNYIRITRYEFHPTVDLPDHLQGPVETEGRPSVTDPRVGGRQIATMTTPQFALARLQLDLEAAQIVRRLMEIQSQPDFEERLAGENEHLNLQATRYGSIRRMLDALPSDPFPEQPTSD